MARKDPTDLTVEDKLKALYQLQLTLSQIDEKRALRGELPLEVEDLENEVEGLNVRLDKIQRDINDYEQAIMQRRADIEEAKASVERYNRQLDEVKNNREYDTLTKEIEFQELEIQLCEKKIKEAVQKVEERKRDMMRAEEQLNDRETALEDKRGELDEIMQETREEEEILKAKAKDYETRIEVWVSFTFSVMLVAVASTRFHLSVSWISRCTRRSSFASIVVVSWLIQSWLALRLRSQQRRSQRSVLSVV